MRTYVVWGTVLKILETTLISLLSSGQGLQARAHVWMGKCGAAGRTLSVYVRRRHRGRRAGWPRVEISHESRG